jgi:hypothetical protein
MGQKEMAINYRTRFAYRIDAWDADGENVIEHLAGVEDLQVAKATYLAACQRWPNASKRQPASSAIRVIALRACHSAGRCSPLGDLTYAQRPWSPLGINA